MQRSCWCYPKGMMLIQGLTSFLFVRLILPVFSSCSCVNYCPWICSSMPIFLRVYLGLLVPQNHVCLSLFQRIFFLYRIFLSVSSHHFISPFALLPAVSASDVPSEDMKCRYKQNNYFRILFHFLCYDFLSSYVGGDFQVLFQFWNSMQRCSMCESELFFLNNVESFSG